MGFFAEVLCIGPFREGLESYLGYPADYYRAARRGAPIVETLFGISGTNQSTEFATYLGISNPLDFNQHLIDADRIDYVGLQSFLRRIADGEELLRHVDILKALSVEGFTFYFVPNG